MIWLKNNWTLILMAVCIFWAVFSHRDRSGLIEDISDLEDSIAVRNERIDSLELEKTLILDSIQIHREAKKKLRDSLNLSKTERNDIRKRYADLYNRIHTSSDSEYQEYLRTRVSSSN